MKYEDYNKMKVEDFKSKVEFMDKYVTDSERAITIALPYVWQTELCTICKCDPCDCPTDFWREANG